MIAFHRISLADKAAYETILNSVPERGCEYSFANLFMWGRQEVAFLHGCVVFFCHFYGRSLYPYPIGNGDKKAAIEAILEDARQEADKLLEDTRHRCEELEREAKISCAEMTARAKAEAAR